MPDRTRLVALLACLAVVAGVLTFTVVGTRRGCSLAGVGWFGYTPLTHTRIEPPDGDCSVAIYRTP